MAKSGPPGRFLCATLIPGVWSWCRLHSCKFCLQIDEIAIDCSRMFNFCMGYTYIKLNDIELYCSNIIANNYKIYTYGDVIRYNVIIYIYYSMYKWRHSSVSVCTCLNKIKRSTVLIFVLNCNIVISITALFLYLKLDFVFKNGETLFQLIHFIIHLTQ